MFMKMVKYESEGPGMINEEEMSNISDLVLLDSLWLAN